MALQQDLSDPVVMKARMRASIAQSEALMAGVRARRRPESPSRRTPNKSKRVNVADMIEQQMQKDNHVIWGFVIYRTTYTNQSDWDEFMVRLRAILEDDFDYCNGRDILGKFALTVMDNKEQFDGASSHDVRRHFQRWTVDNYKIEQPQSQVTGEEALSTGHYSRYCFAVQVDTESLRSIIYEESTPLRPWVKVVKKAWTQDPEREADSEDDDGNENEDEDDAASEPDEPIEGVKQYDVGWVKVPFSGVMTEWYEYSAERNEWARTYERPPKMRDT